MLPHTVARVVPPLARVLSPAFPSLTSLSALSSGFHTSSTSYGGGRRTQPKGTWPRPIPQARTRAQNDREHAELRAAARAEWDDRQAPPHIGRQPKQQLGGEPRRDRSEARFLSFQEARNARDGFIQPDPWQGKGRSQRPFVKSPDPLTDPKYAERNRRLPNHTFGVRSGSPHAKGSHQSQSQGNFRFHSGQEEPRFQRDGRDQRPQRESRDRVHAPGQTTSQRLAPVMKGVKARTAAAMGRAQPMTLRVPAAVAPSWGNDLAANHGQSRHENVAKAMGKSFSAYPLHEGLLEAVKERLPEAKSTPIQALSLARLIPNLTKSSKKDSKEEVEPVRAVLGAETGSGKTLAYLLPLLHALKASDPGLPPPGDFETVSPRALVLSPTHELTRQSTRVAKGLTHAAKLRVAGASSPGSVARLGPIDVLFATGRSASNLLGLEVEELDGPKGSPYPKPEHQKSGDEKDKDKDEKEYEKEKVLELERVQWLVIDEADVLLGPTFINETTRLIKEVRSATPNLNVLLVTATLPPSLLRVLEGDVFGKGPEFEQILSPGLHRLPKHLDTRFVPWSGGGNRLADIVHEIKRGIADDTLEAKVSGGEWTPRAVVFCGSVGQVKSVAAALEEKELPTLAWTSDAPERTARQGHNGPLDVFLVQDNAKSTKKVKRSKKDPRVLVTTSLLSRGLDFSEDVTNIYLVDPPRNVLDFVHRAGRAGRAGRPGRVVVFGANGINDLKYGKEIKSVLGKVERRQAVKPGGRTYSGREFERRERR